MDEQSQLSTGTPSSDTRPEVELTHPDDQLTKAAEERDWATGHGEESQRAEEAWDAFPGDSEYEVDFPEELTVKEDQMGHTSKGDDGPYVGKIGQFSPYLASLLPSEPELVVTVTANHPDGREFETTFRQAFPEGTCGAEYFADAISNTAYAALAGFRSSQSSR